MPNLNIESIQSIGETEIKQIHFMAQSVFNTWDPNRFQTRFNENKNFLLLFANMNDQIVGFKLGYELEPQKFYSWLGGVLPDFRRQGIASQLMLAQHEWCKTHGYKEIQTRSIWHNSNMHALNFKFGFKKLRSDETERGLKTVFSLSLMSPDKITD